MDVLASQHDDIGASLCSVQEQAECEPRASADWMHGLKCLDVGLRPSPIAIGLDLGGPDSLRRVIGAHGLFNAVLHQRTNGLEEVVGCLRRTGLRCDHALEVFGPKKRYALVAVLLTKPFQDILAGALSLRRKVPKRPGVEIAPHRGSHRAGLDMLGADLDTRGSLYRRLVRRHELGRPWQAGQGRTLETRPTEIPARVAVPIDETLHVFRRPAHQMRSHSFASALGS